MPADHHEDELVETLLLTLFAFGILLGITFAIAAMLLVEWSLR